jgi:hypothetical protein
MSGKRSSRDLAVAIGLGALLAFDLVTGAEPGRDEALPSVLLVLAVWLASLALMIARHPARQLRFSDPGVLVLLWSAYYFFVPVGSWLSGQTLFLEGRRTADLTVDHVVHVQYLHAAFLAVFSLTYHLLVPRFGFVSLADEALLARLPKAGWLILIGLLPMLAEVITRVVTTGALRPETLYMEAWEAQRTATDASRAAGGGDYVLTQLLYKAGFYGRMLLGAGLGVLFVRAWKARRIWPLLGFHALLPLLLYFSVGTRSAAVFPFLIALIFADLIAGPLSWRYLLSMAVLGFAFFYFYGFFRQNQTEDVVAAVTTSFEELGESRELELAEAENSVMLVKEVYTIDYAQREGTRGAWSYFVDLALTPVPSQLRPDKPQPMSEFLTREILGDDLVEAGVGVAGSTLAEGYLAEEEIGVVLVAIALGLLCGAVVRGLGRRDPRRGGTPIWQMVLLACFASQAVLFVRGDFGELMVYALYYVLVPALAMRIYLRLRPSSRWTVALAPA